MRNNEKFYFADFFVIVCGLFNELSAHPSWAIVADDKNQAYVSDLEKIWKIDASGKRRKQSRRAGRFGCRRRKQIGRTNG